MPFLLAATSRKLSNLLFYLSRHLDFLVLVGFGFCFSNLLEVLPLLLFEFIIPMIVSASATTAT